MATGDQVRILSSFLFVLDSYTSSEATCNEVPYNQIPDASEGASKDVCRFAAESHCLSSACMHPLLCFWAWVWQTLLARVLSS
jgi:hypothetical protein